LAVDYVELPIEATGDTINMSTMNGQSNEAAGQEPKLIINGLDEADILAFIRSLIDQNSDLAKKFEQIDALMKLAEEQVETARAEAEKIITEANQIAEKTSQEKLLIAQQQAQEIIKAAEEQASRIISEAKQKGRAVEWQARQILNAAKEKTEQLLVKSESFSEDEPKETSEADPKKSHSNSSSMEVKQAIPPSGQEGEGKEENSELYDGTVELVIPPPVAPTRLLKLVRQLRRTRQISILNLDVSLAKGARIKLFLRTRIPLLKILEAIPEVEKVSGELKKANGAHNYPQTRDELSAKSILVQIKRR
jgi:cell division septum initiation protein DivIVA